MHSIVYILPELFLSIVIMTLLMLGVFIQKSFKLIYLLTILSLVLAIVLVLNQPDQIKIIFKPSLLGDNMIQTKFMILPVDDKHRW